MTDVDETYETAELEDGETELGVLHIASPTAAITLSIEEVVANWTCRVRLYSDHGVATGDLDRQPWEDPASWSGIILDVGLDLADTSLDNSVDDGWEATITGMSEDTLGSTWIAVTNYVGQPEELVVTLTGTMEVTVSDEALYPNPNIDFPATYRTAGAPGPADPNTYLRTVEDDVPFDPTDAEEREILLGYATYVGGFSRKAFSEVDGDWTW